MLTTHTVAAFDGLRALAQRYLGAASRWPEIANLNGLTSSADLSALAGKEILIPLGDQQAESPYLEDLAIENGDLVLTAGGDLKTITGRENLIRALLRAFATERGELSEHPDHGFDPEQYVGQARGVVTEKLLLTEARRVFMGDPRVLEVSEPSVTYDGNRRWYRIAATIKDILGKRIRFDSGTSA